MGNGRRQLTLATRESVTLNISSRYEYPGSAENNSALRLVNQLGVGLELDVYDGNLTHNNANDFEQAIIENVRTGEMWHIYATVGSGWNANPWRMLYFPGLKA